PKYILLDHSPYIHAYQTMECIANSCTLVESRVFGSGSDVCLSDKMRNSSWVCLFSEFIFMAGCLYLPRTFSI
ncbi:hypothetical protein PS059_24895, partial [Shigella sonnei]|nr:hypothetical protein [Shigella sonnei]